MNFNFEKLNVYQQSIEFTNQVFDKTKRWPTKYQFSLGEQLRRASLSIPLNIAEGSSRTKKEFKRFLSIARGSCFECIPLVDISWKQKLTSSKEKTIWYNQLLVLAKMLSSLRNSLSK